ncbi:hypothetical protein J8I87_07510 [Paraburkholderia sp. LEh10]|nr:hypothetical protein [Paraburkholderia sp. LEh10]
MFNAAALQSKLNKTGRSKQSSLAWRTGALLREPSIHFVLVLAHPLSRNENARSKQFSKRTQFHWLNGPAASPAAAS